MKASNNNWWRGGVIYQIYPRSYKDGNGDGVGDLLGITQSLPYLAKLGVDAIWISPIFKSPMKDFGYDVSDYCDIDPLFGSLDDFRSLLARAKELGLKVIIDQVLSHTSDQHAWFKESRSSRSNAKADWYVWADAQGDGTAPNNWMSVFGGSAWSWDTRRKQYYLHNFLDSQPDLNFHCPAVQDALLASVKFWLDLGVNGFRLDTANFYFHSKDLQNNPGKGVPKAEELATKSYNPYEWQWHVHDKSQPENLAFLKRLRSLLDQYPDTTMVGEIGDDDSLNIIAQYTADGDKLHMAYSFDLLSPHSSSSYFHELLTKFDAKNKTGWPSWAIANHDVTRVATRWAHEGKPCLEKLKLAAAFQMCLRGSPCMYQGDELGLPEAKLNYEDLQDPVGIRMWPETQGRDGCRTPMPWRSDEADAGFGSGSAKPWLPIPAEHRLLAVSNQEEQRDSMLHFYRQLLAWRKTNPLLIAGEMQLLPAHDQIIAFTRSLANQTWVCAFNFSATAAEMKLHVAAIGQTQAIPGLLAGRVAGAASEQTLQLPAWGALLIPIDAMLKDHHVAN